MRIPPPLEIGPLDAAAASHVRDLVDAAAAADNVAPLSEQTLLSLDTDAPTLTHALARNKNGAVVGYAQIDRGGEFASAEIVVHPEHRRRGTGRVLLKIAVRDATLPARSGEPGDARKKLRVWAHGNLAAAQSLARSAGLVSTRELLLLERPLNVADEVPPVLADGLRLRQLDPQVDGPRWVDLNRAAFAHHPEQGRLTVQDLAARQAEDWYHPAGFQLLESDEPGSDRPLGYIWTKFPANQPEPTREGEIYAIGVDPAQQGSGYGAILLKTGLAHLANVGAHTVILYVEGDNEPAVRLYEKSGFTRRGIDVQYGAA